MAELSEADAARYPAALRNDAEKLRLLIAGLRAARRYCGWHVTGVVTDEDVVIDGPGSRLLALPTLKLADDGLTAVTECGVALDPATELDVSPRGLVNKRSGAWWSGRFGAVLVTMTHGFEDAEDFDNAVVSFVTRNANGRRRVVGPFQYDTDAMDAASPFSVVERSLLDQYRLEPAP